MSNEIQKISESHPAVLQTGERSMFIVNNTGGVINLAYTPAKPQVTSRKLLEIIQNFSQEYYQLLVYGSTKLGVPYVGSMDSVTYAVDRMIWNDYMPPELYRGNTRLSDETISNMLRLPAIICNENTDYNGITNPEQKAIYGYISKIMKTIDGVKVSYRQIQLFPQHVLNEYSIDFGINIGKGITDLNHSAWYVNKVNLFEAFREAHIDVLEP